MRSLADNDECWILRHLYDHLGVTNPLLKRVYLNQFDCIRKHCYFRDLVKYFYHFLSQNHFENTWGMKVMYNCQRKAFYLFCKSILKNGLDLTTFGVEMFLSSNVPLNFVAEIFWLLYFIFIFHLCWIQLLRRAAVSIMLGPIPNFNLGMRYI